MGSVSEGVIGYRRPQYNVWGPAVDMARKLELTGKINHIQVLFHCRQSNSVAATIAYSNLTFQCFPGVWSLVNGGDFIEAPGQIKDRWLFLSPPLTFLRFEVATHCIQSAYSNH